MTLYLSVEILEEFVIHVEKSKDENAIKTMTFGILSHYFSPTGGYAVAFGPRREGHYTDFVILRMPPLPPAERGIFDHCVVKARCESVDVQTALAELESDGGLTNTEHGRCWALLIVGARFSFFEYHQNLPPGRRLLSRVPLGGSTNEFHALHDSPAVDKMLRHMYRHPVPPAREDTGDENCSVVAF